MAINRKRKTRDPLNKENRSFKADLSPFSLNRALETMKEMGCKSRSVFTEMAIENFIKGHGK